MTKTHFFLSGPSLCVTLKFQDRALMSSALSLADRFQVKIEGESNKPTEETLLAFLEVYSKRKHSEVPLSLDALTPFRKKVLQTLQKVIFGNVTSYGELASESGHSGAARAVGTACHFNPFPLFIPCHRVIAASGKIGGFALDISIKKLLLSFEASNS